MPINSFPAVTILRRTLAILIVILCRCTPGLAAEPLANDGLSVDALYGVPLASLGGALTLSTENVALSRVDLALADAGAGASLRADPPASGLRFPVASTTQPITTGSAKRKCSICCNTVASGSTARGRSTFFTRVSFSRYDSADWMSAPVAHDHGNRPLMRCAG